MEISSTTNKLQRLIVEWREVIKPKTPPGAIESLETILNSGADLDAVEQLTPCIPYVFWDTDLIKFFLQRGRDVNAADYAGNTALHLAAAHTRILAVQFLLEHEADPNLKNKSGDTPLWMAIKAMQNPSTWSCKVEECAKLLIKYGSDITVRNAEGLTFLHAKFINMESPDLIRLLVDRFSEVDVRASKFNFEKTPLMSAVENSNLGLCKYLVNDRKADVNARDSLGRTPLHYAVAKGHSECAQLLLSKGADPSVILTCKMPSFYLSMAVIQVDTCVRDTKKRIEMYEMLGARCILNGDFLKYGLVLWKKALGMRTKSRFPKPPPSEDQKTLYKVENDPFSTESDFDNSLPDDETLYRLALLTLDRISNGSSWSLLDALSILLEYRKLDHTKYELLREMLPKVAKKMSFEEASSLQHDFFNCFCSPFNHSIIYIRLFSSNVIFFVKIFLAPIKNWIKNVVGGKQVRDLEKIYKVLSFITFKSGCRRFYATGVLKALTRLDPRDKEGNGLLHLACKKGHLTLAHELIDSGSDVTIENLYGEMPIEQLLPRTHENAEQIRDLVLKMLSKGAHLDYKAIPSFGKSPLAQQLTDFNELPHVTLQCLTARVLARNYVNYKDVIHRLPKTLITFVDKHFYDENCTVIH